MKKIALSAGKFAIVDDDDFQRVAKFKWSVCAKTSKNMYAKRNAGNGKFPSLHRFIMPAPIGLEIDHIDGDGLNCQKRNLRICSASENRRNMRPRCALGIKGVRWEQDRNKYLARIKTGGRSINLGRYKTAAEAAMAYDSAALKYFGKFARLNFKKQPSLPQVFFCGPKETRNDDRANRRGRNDLDSP